MFQHLVNCAEMFEHSHDTHVESVLGDLVLDSGNWRYFLHFHICLLCVHHNVFSYSGTLSEQMVIIQVSEV